ncbi:S8/S53 family peptidase [Mesorhizobium cantuariense]|uniref:S8/S53 family peptidase n=1 Tax=Mesorhizobium cantuariense TaxID=1300275 RepID=A0ABV7MXH1_9HYPH
MIEHSGKLLIKVLGAPYSSLLSGPNRLQIANYTLEPLFPGAQTLRTFSKSRKSDHWLLAIPESIDPYINPWDVAHRVAKAAKYTLYAEPDILHTRHSPSPVEPSNGLNRHWPPSIAVSPGWHLGPNYTGFRSSTAKKYDGKGIRIAHLDTGYSPTHRSRPVNLLTSLSANFYEGGKDAVDHGTAIGNPGHGPATLALLAGNELDMIFGGHRFQDYIGGAPMSEVVPVRIGASVIHFFTSAMALGIDYALAPRGDPKNRCDVITISHGGLPSLAWAAAVNNVYEAGIVVAAASGDNLIVAGIDLPGHETIWPSRFRRVITVLGATYDKLPYVTDAPLVLQGSYGPQSIMDKAIAAYTPNVVWVRFDTATGYDMDGGGTSASTPQVAAACALWLQKNKADYPANWKRVAACRYALFSGAYKGSNHSRSRGRLGKDPDTYLGTGILDAPGMLNAPVPKSLQKEPVDEVDLTFWQVDMQMGEPKSCEEMMYAVEAAQLFYRNSSSDLVRQALLGSQEPGSTRSTRLRDLVGVSAECSVSLKTRLE